MRTKLKKTITVVALYVAAGLAITCLVMSMLNSERVDWVKVTFIGSNPGGPDAVPSEDANKEKPEYRLDVVHSRGTHACATVENRSAANSVVFTFVEDLPVSQIRELLLIKEDKAQHDTLARVRFSTKPVSTDEYRFEVASSRRFQVGIRWFFSTVVGKAISLGITVGIAVAIVMAFV